MSRPTRSRRSASPPGSSAGTASTARPGRGRDRDGSRSPAPTARRSRPSRRSRRWSRPPRSTASRPSGCSPTSGATGSSASCSSASAATRSASSRASGSSSPRSARATSTAATAPAGRASGASSAAARVRRGSSNDAAAEVAARILNAHVDDLDAIVLGGDRFALATVMEDVRVRRFARFTSDRIFDVPDPKLAVLRAMPGPLPRDDPEPSSSSRGRAEPGRVARMLSPP